MNNLEPTTKRIVVGRVISDKRQATRTVETTWSRRDPIYGKIVRTRTRYHVHDPKHECQMGDLVEIKEVRPVSKTKSWQLVRVLEKGEI